MQTIKTSLLTIAMLLCSIVANAHDFEVDGIYYKITSSEDLTVSVSYQGNGSTAYPDEYIGEVVIPESVVYNDKTYSVTSIGYKAFYGCSNLTSITIPCSIVCIISVH